jgi:hypothetical protein
MTGEGKCSEKTPFTTNPNQNLVVFIQGIHCAMVANYRLSHCAAQAINTVYKYVIFHLRATFGGSENAVPLLILSEEGHNVANFSSDNWLSKLTFFVGYLGLSR